MKNRLHLQRKSCFVLRKKCQIGENSLRNRTRNMKKHGRCKSICRAKIRFCPHTPRRGPQMNLKRSANATVREIFSHDPGDVRNAPPSAAAPSRSATALRCLAQSVLMTAAPLSFHFVIRFIDVNCSRNRRTCQFPVLHKLTEKLTGLLFGLHNPADYLTRQTSAPSASSTTSVAPACMSPCRIVRAMSVSAFDCR